MFMEQPLDEADAAAGVATFDVLVAGVDRCVAAGRFGSAGPAATAATQLWAVTHGLVTLQLVGWLAPDKRSTAWSGPRTTCSSPTGTTRAPRVDLSLPPVAGSASDRREPALGLALGTSTSPGPPGTEVRGPLADHRLVVREATRSVQSAHLVTPSA